MYSFLCQAPDSIRWHLAYMQALSIFSLPMCLAVLWTSFWTVSKYYCKHCFALDPEASLQ